MSLYFARKSIRLLISISLKVVKVAAVFCESFRRSAIFKRIRDILTRRSRRDPGIRPGSSCSCVGFDFAGVAGDGGLDSIFGCGGGIGLDTDSFFANLKKII